MGPSKVTDRNESDYGVVSRPKSSNGYWLSILLPLVYGISNLRQPYATLNFEYKMTTICSWGLFLQTVNLFVRFHIEIPKLIIRIGTALLPGSIMAILFVICLKQDILVAIFWGLSTTLGYFWLYLKLLKSFPLSFTLGEASIISQGLILFILNSILKIPMYIAEPPTSDFDSMNAIMLAGLFSLLIASVLLYKIKLLRHIYLFYPFGILLVCIVCTMPVTKSFPIITLLAFITNEWKRIFIIVIYVGLVSITVVTVSCQLHKEEKASTSVRKIFHFLIVCVYVIGLLYSCTLLYIASGLVLALFVLLEIVRLSEIPPFAEHIHNAVSAFIDEKDAGLVALTPFYLLIGCSMPMWIIPCPCVLTDSAIDNLVPMMSGVLSIGIGDSAASIIGVRFGRHKWRNSSKSIEGTVASIISQGLFMYLLYWNQFIHLTDLKAATSILAIIVTSLVEAFTDQVDNLVLPFIFYIIS